MTSARPAIHPAAVPNDLPLERLRIRPGRDGSVAVDPATAGWRYLGFRTVELAAGGRLDVGTVDHEACIVVIGGGGIVVRPVDGEPIELDGRASPFDGLPDAAYLPLGAQRIEGRTVRSSIEARPVAGNGRVRIAIAEAPRSRTAGVADRPQAIGPDAVTVEVRGAGRSTRQINHIIPPGYPADRLLLVEVLTPAGNWSSWPPHKHDLDDMPREAVLEEVYHYGFRTAGGLGDPAALPAGRQPARAGAGWPVVRRRRRCRARDRWLPPLRRHRRRRRLLPQRPRRRTTHDGLFVRPVAGPGSAAMGQRGARPARPDGPAAPLNIWAGCASRPLGLRSTG